MLLALGMVAGREASEATTRRLMRFLTARSRARVRLAAAIALVHVAEPYPAAAFDLLGDALERPSSYGRSVYFNDGDLVGLVSVLLERIGRREPYRAHAIEILSRVVGRTEGDTRALACESLLLLAFPSPKQGTRLLPEDLTAEQLAVLRAIAAVTGRVAYFSTDSLLRNLGFPPEGDLGHFTGTAIGPAATPLTVGRTQRSAFFWGRLVEDGKARPEEVARAIAALGPDEAVDLCFALAPGPGSARVAIGLAVFGVLGAKARARVEHHARGLAARPSSYFGPATLAAVGLLRLLGQGEEPAPELDRLLLDAVRGEVGRPYEREMLAKLSHERRERLGL